MNSDNDLLSARLRLTDLARVGAAGLRYRPARVFLSALGVAIGVAAMVAVVGISASSTEDLNRRLEALGTNMLRVTPGHSIGPGEQAELPLTSVDMIDQVELVTAVAATGTVRKAHVYRNDHIPTGHTGGLAVLAAQLNLPETVGAMLAAGAWLNEATTQYPAVVLGTEAADRLGVGTSGLGQQVWLGDQWFTVVGILEAVPLAPELDSAALVGWQAAQSNLGFGGHPSTIYALTNPDAVEAVWRVLARTANPENPGEVQVSRPSDLLAAQREVNTTVTNLLLGLGAIALLVGGIGVANTMVIAVLERRSEIGLRRSLGATRRHIRHQFLAESLLLSAAGGLGGVLLGIAATMGYAAYSGWPILVPAWVMAGGLGATVLIGGLAGLYPAVRAARLAPTEALSGP